MLCKQQKQKKKEKAPPCPLAREHCVQTNSAAQPKGHTGGWEEKLGKPDWLDDFWLHAISLQLALTFPPRKPCIQQRLTRLSFRQL